MTDDRDTEGRGRMTEVRSQTTEVRDERGPWPRASSLIGKNKIESIPPTIPFLIAASGLLQPISSPTISNHGP